MPYYNIVKAGNRVTGVIEATTHKRIKAATSNFEWAVGKAVAELGEWLNRHRMSLTPVVSIDDARAALNVQGSLEL